MITITLQNREIVNKPFIHYQEVWIIKTPKIHDVSVTYQIVFKANKNRRPIFKIYRKLPDNQLIYISPEQHPARVYKIKQLLQYQLESYNKEFGNKKN